MVKLRRIVVTLLLGGALAWLAVAVWLHCWFCSKLPSVPNPITGQKYRLVVNHGFVRYGSQREFWAFHQVQGLQPVAMLMVLVAVGIGVIYEDFHIGRSGR